MSTSPNVRLFRISLSRLRVAVTRTVTRTDSSTATRTVTRTAARASKDSCKLCRDRHQYRDARSVGRKTCNHQLWYSWLTERVSENTLECTKKQGWKETQMAMWHAVCENYTVINLLQTHSLRVSHCARFHIASDNSFYIGRCMWVECACLPASLGRQTDRRNVLVDEYREAERRKRSAKQRRLRHSAT